MYETGTTNLPPVPGVKGTFPHVVLRHLMIKESGSKSVDLTQRKESFKFCFFGGFWEKVARAVLD